MESMQKIYDFVKEQWKGRARVQGYKPDTAEYINAEYEFFTGAMSTIWAIGTVGLPEGFDKWDIQQKNAAVAPAQWIVPALSGNSITTGNPPIEEVEETDVNNRGQDI